MHDENIQISIRASKQANRQDNKQQQQHSNVINTYLHKFYRFLRLPYDITSRLTLHDIDIKFLDSI
jgi:hypothetical protein